MRSTPSFLSLALTCSFALVCSSEVTKAQQTTISFDSGAQFLYSNSAKTTQLTAGILTTIGDGAVLQLGYYNAATVATPFAGTFIPLSGVTSANTAYNNTSIGDLNSNGAGNGQFALSLSFTQGNSTTGNNLPTVGTPLSIRFFSDTTIAASKLFNAVADPTNANWLWQTPAIPGPTETISLDQTGLVWQGGATSAFFTSLPVPEPSTFALAAMGLVGTGWMMRRRQVRRSAW